MPYDKSCQGIEHRLVHNYYNYSHNFQVTLTIVCIILRMSQNPQFGVVLLLKTIQQFKASVLYKKRDGRKQKAGQFFYHVERFGTHINTPSRVGGISCTYYQIYILIADSIIATTRCVRFDSSFNPTK